MSLATLKSFLKDRNQTLTHTPVVIAGDKRVPYDDVMKVMAQLKSQGVARVGLLVKSP
jgi:biopolymer transport protein TolR